MASHLFSEISTPSIRVGTRKWYTVPVSILAHAAVLAVMVVVPLLAADVLPVPPTMMAFVTAPPPPPPARPAEPQPAPVVDVLPSFAPIEAQVEILPETGFDLTRVDGVEGGVIGGVVGGVVDALLAAPPPPQPVPVGGDITRPGRTKSVQPVYPPVAQAARVSGIVILEAVIGVDGRVTDVHVLRSVPLLDEAAIAAVEQWEYTPTLLNDVPVPVVMTVTVTFTLN